MAGFGDTGGRGGFGASFPMRGAAPTSEEVGYMPSWSDWEADWNARREALGRPQASASVNTVYNHPDGWNMLAPQGDGIGARPMAPTPDNLGSFAPPNWSTVDNSVRPVAPTPENLDSFLDSFSATAAPDYTALDAERQAALTRYEPVFRQQSAYDRMAGRGMENGILSEAYSDANFGRVSGTPFASQPDAAGVNMDWTGVYNPANGSGSIGGRRRWGV